MKRRWQLWQPGSVSPKHWTLKSLLDSCPRQESQETELRRCPGMSHSRSETSPNVSMAAATTAGQGGCWSYGAKEKFRPQCRHHVNMSTKLSLLNMNQPGQR